MPDLDGRRRQSGRRGLGVTGMHAGIRRPRMFSKSAGDLRRSAFAEQYRSGDRENRALFRRGRPGSLALLPIRRYELFGPGNQPTPQRFEDLP